MIEVRIKRRNSRGLLSLGVTLMWLISLILIGCVGLGFNIGMACYYQEKLCYVADQAAHFAAVRYCWNQNINGMSGVQGDTQIMVSRLLTDLGLPSGSVVVTLNGQTMTSLVQVSGLVLPGKGNLPGFINQQATSAADLTADQPPGVAYFSFQGDPSAKAVAVPVWGWYVEGISDNGVPPAPLPDINLERGFGALYYSVTFDLPTGTTFSVDPGTPKAPGVP